MEKHSNYELNSFLTILMERWDESAAQAIVDAFHTLPIASDFTSITTVTKNNASVTGHTDKAGDITVHDKETKVVVRGESQEDTARVGYYKIKQRKTEGVFLITWYHFWASDTTTMSFGQTPAPIFGLEYERETLKPCALLRWDFLKEEGSKTPLRLLLKQLFACLFGTLAYERVSYVGNPTVLFGKSNLKAV